MNIKYSILHISDLHKVPSQSYDDLLLSLENDSEAREEEGISKEKIIVISGDLIEGDKNRRGDYNKRIENQYNEVSDFLKKLVDAVLDGDKRRLIIVPGNHDFSMPDSIRSMVKSPSKKRQLDYVIYKKLQSIRWNWKDFSFYYINQQDLYDARFHAFEKFYNEFFNGIYTLPKNVECNAYIVDLEEFNITFICFNSCYRLDHLNQTGCICPSALTKIQPELRKYYRQGRLIIGVWHHHIAGLPHENNYMDNRILNAMMKSHIQIGLFGHQHKSEILHEYRDISSDQNMLLISSGTLYGGTEAQFDGQKRQFNVLEVNMNTKQNKANITIHCREDKSIDNFAIPDWGVKGIGVKGKDKVDYEISLFEPDIKAKILSVSKQVYMDNNYYGACLKLKKIGLKDDMCCKVYESYLKLLNDQQKIVLIGLNPMTNVQYMYVLDAAMNKRNKNLIIKLLSDKYLRFDSVQVNELKDKARLEISL